MDAKKLNDKAMFFLNNIFEEIESQRIDLSTWKIDHLCYRVSSNKNYEKMKGVMASFSTLLSEAKISGRPISTYKLNEPIVYKNYIIELIEVPAPKMGAQTIEGFEHIEVVTSESFDEIMENYPQLNFETKALSKKINPELVIKFGDCSLKFHHQSLEDVIKQELLELK